MKYQIFHKLTNKPIRNSKTLEIIEFDSLKDAEIRCELKNKQMHAAFYKIVEVSK